MSPLRELLTCWAVDSSSSCSSIPTSCAMSSSCCHFSSRRSFVLRTRRRLFFPLSITMMLALAAVEEKSLLNMGTARGAPVTASSSSSDHGGLVLPSHGSSSFKSESAAKHQNKFSFVKTAARSLSPFKDFSFKTSWLQGSRQRRVTSVEPFRGDRCISDDAEHEGRVMALAPRDTHGSPNSRSDASASATTSLRRQCASEANSTRTRSAPVVGCGRVAVAQAMPDGHETTDVVIYSRSRAGSSDKGGETTTGIQEPGPDSGRDWQENNFGQLERPADHASEEKGARGGSKESTASVATSRSGSLTGSSSWGQNFDFSRLTTACSMTEAGGQVVLVPGGGTGTSSGKVFTSMALAQLQDKLGFPGNSTSPSSSSGAASGANFGGAAASFLLQDRRKRSGSRGVLAAQPAHLPQQVVEDDELPFDLDDDHDLPSAEDAERSVCFANRRELKLHSRRAAVREEDRERSSRNVNISTTSQLSTLACLNGLVGGPAGEVSRATLVQFAGKELPRADRQDVRDKCDRQEVRVNSSTGSPASGDGANSRDQREQERWCNTTTLVDAGEWNPVYVISSSENLHLEAGESSASHKPDLKSSGGRPEEQVARAGASDPESHDIEDCAASFGRLKVSGACEEKICSSRGAASPSETEAAATSGPRSSLLALCRGSSCGIAYEGSESPTERAARRKRSSQLPRVEVAVSTAAHGHEEFAGREGAVVGEDTSEDVPDDGVSDEGARTGEMSPPFSPSGTSAQSVERFSSRPLETWKRKTVFPENEDEDQQRLAEGRADLTLQRNTSGTYTEGPAFNRHLAVDTYSSGESQSAGSQPDAAPGSSGPPGSSSRTPTSAASAMVRSFGPSPCDGQPRRGAPSRSNRMTKRMRAGGSTSIPVLPLEEQQQVTPTVAEIETRTSNLVGASSSSRSSGSRIRSPSRETAPLSPLSPATLCLSSSSNSRKSLAAFSRQTLSHASAFSSPLQTSSSSVRLSASSSGSLWSLDGNHMGGPAEGSGSVPVAHSQDETEGDQGGNPASSSAGATPPSERRNARVGGTTGSDEEGKCEPKSAMLGAVAGGGRD